MLTSFASLAALSLINVSKVNMRDVAAEWEIVIRANFEDVVHSMQITDVTTYHLDADGADMFDNGNVLHVKTATEEATALTYDDDCASILDFKPSGIGDIVYKNCFIRTAHISIFKSESGMIREFGTTGGLGADSLGRVGGNDVPFSLTAHGSEVAGWFKFVSRGTDSTMQDLNDAVCPQHSWTDACRLDGSSDPCTGPDVKATVNHLIITLPGATRTLSCDTNLDEDTVTFPTGVTTVVHIVWGGYKVDPDADVFAGTGSIAHQFSADDAKIIFDAIATKLLDVTKPVPQPSPTPQPEEEPVAEETTNDSGVTNETQEINVALLTGCTFGAFFLGCILALGYFKFVRPRLQARTERIALTGIAVKGGKPSNSSEWRVGGDGGQKPRFNKAKEPVIKI